MALSAVIFDLDGTLVDTNGLHARAWYQVLKDFGFHIPEDRIALEIGKGGDKLVPALLGERAAEEEGRALRDAHGEAYLALIDGMDVRVFPGVRALFEALRVWGLKIAVATASKERDLEKVMQQADLDLFSLADVVIHDDDVERSKPEPDVVRAAVQKLGLSPAQCVMVGDTPYDAQAAKQAGVVCLCLLTGVHDAQTLLRAGARAVYADPADLLERLEEALALASPGSAQLTNDLIDQLMEAALEEARTGLSEGEMPFGSVVARGDGTIIARGHNRAQQENNPLAHAERVALQAAVGVAPHDARDLILVTTVEPCVMCLGAAMEVRVDTIIYGLEAPSNGGAGRCGPIERPGALMPRLVPGVRAEESRRLMAAWHAEHPEAAFVEDLLAS